MTKCINIQTVLSAIVATFAMVVLTIVLMGAANAQNAIAKAKTNAQSASVSSGTGVGLSSSGNINQTFEGTTGRMVRGDNTKTTVENVPDVIPPNITPTAPCVLPISAGASVVGIGAALGFPIIDENCETINMGVYLAQLEASNENLKGMNLSLHYVCSRDKEVQEIVMIRGVADCGKMKPVAAVEPASLTPTPAPKAEKPKRFIGSGNQTGCRFGFDRSTGQCAKVQASIVDTRDDA